MALEELEMALRREEQERSQRINAETLLSNRLEILEFDFYLCFIFYVVCFVSLYFIHGFTKWFPFCL